MYMRYDNPWNSENNHHYKQQQITTTKESERQHNEICCRPRLLCSNIIVQYVTGPMFSWRLVVLLRMPVWWRRQVPFPVKLDKVMRGNQSSIIHELEQIWCFPYNNSYRLHSNINLITVNHYGIFGYFCLTL